MFDEYLTIEEQMARGRDLTKKMASIDSDDSGAEETEAFVPTKDSNLDLEDPGIHFSPFLIFFFSLFLFRHY